MILPRLVITVTLSITLLIVLKKHRVRIGPDCDRVRPKRIICLVAVFFCHLWRKISISVVIITVWPIVSRVNFILSVFLVPPVSFLTILLFLLLRRRISWITFAFIIAWSRTWTWWRLFPVILSLSASVVSPSVSDIRVSFVLDISWILTISAFTRWTGTISTLLHLVFVILTFTIVIVPWLPTGIRRVWYWILFWLWIWRIRPASWRWWRAALFEVAFFARQCDLKLLRTCTANFCLRRHLNDRTWFLFRKNDLFLCF